jgi:hypothetical protein
MAGITTAGYSEPWLLWMLAAAYPRSYKLRSEKRVKAVTGCANGSPTAADAIENKVQETFAICGDDIIAALRITLIANAFPEAEIDRLSAAVSSGFACGKVTGAQAERR